MWFSYALKACLLVIGMTACAPTVSRYPYASEPDPRARPYVIAVSDALSIRVWGNADLNTDATVRPDGTITMPLVGDIPAAGRTTAEVRQTISQALRAYVKDAPSVTVAVTHIGYRVAVVGNVSRPGVYESQHYLTVSEAIVLAGGPSRFASPDETVIIRTGVNGQVRRIPIQYDQVELGLRPDQDLVLLSGDRVYVP
ncbi:MAG: polysaccharide biosynthesis/export family protein [Polyangiaceae bacterium]|nr:polysaccharide biosynthesis/export family protein [Polyangiaceae bacterium]